MYFVIDNESFLQEKEFEVRLHPRTKKKIRNAAIYIGVVGSCLSFALWGDRLFDKKSETTDSE